MQARSSLHLLRLSDDKYRENACFFFLSMFFHQVQIKKDEESTCKKFEKKIILICISIYTF